MDLIKILIIEDEPAAVNRLKKELAALTDYSFEVLNILDSVQEASQWLQTHSPDLIFMDIQLTDGISFEIFKQVAVNAPVIFTTAYDEYALQAFKVNSIDYLLKPVNPADLRTAMAKYQQNRRPEDAYFNRLIHMANEMRPEKYRSGFLVSFRQKMLLINVSDVAYFYVKERGTFMRKKDQTEFVVEHFLDELERQLDPALFYRANRQFLVARSSILEVEPYFNSKLLLTLSPPAPSPVTVSKERATHFKQWANY